LNPLLFKKCLAVESSSMRDEFTKTLEHISQQPQQMKWRDADPDTLKILESFHSTLAKKVCDLRSSWNDGSRAFVVPMFHVTTSQIAKEIVTKGFNDVQENGWFGKGVYFTSSVEFALRQCKQLQASKQNENVVVLICLVITGSAFPVSKSVIYFHRGEEKYMVAKDCFLGKGCSPGYQSHYTLVLLNEWENMTEADEMNLKAENKIVFDKIIHFNPIKQSDQKDDSVDELVIFSPHQAIPIFWCEL